MSKDMRGLTFLLEKPFRFFFTIAGLFLFFGLTSLHSSNTVEDYIEATGKVCNLEAEQVLHQQSYVTRYNYDLIWYDDGEEYVKHFDEQVDPREEGETTIWVHPDNVDAVFSHSDEIKNSGSVYLFIGIGSGIIGIFLYIHMKKNRYESRQQKIERLEDTKLYSILAFLLSLFAMGYSFYSTYSDAKKGTYVNPVLYDITIACGVIALICLIIFFKARHQLKNSP